MFRLFETALDPAHQPARPEPPAHRHRLLLSGARLCAAATAGLSGAAAVLLHARRARMGHLPGRLGAAARRGVRLIFAP
jgi:hypothetical protein